MIIYIINTCAVFDYSSKIEVKNYEITTKTKGNTINVTYNGKDVMIPLSNIAAIEDK